ncbi:hypothetical protein D3C83_108110 [compost metagenome]
MPSMRVAISDSSLSLAGSFGAGIEVPSLSSVIERAVAGERSFTPSKRFDFSTTSPIHFRYLALAREATPCESLLM